MCQGYCYSKYNTLMHFLNLMKCYWLNPDLNSIQAFGKDVRTLLVVSCQKIFFEPGHNYYHYGPVLTGSSGSNSGSTGYGFYGGGASYNATNDMDLAVSSNTKELPPSVSKDRTENTEAGFVFFCSTGFQPRLI